MMDPHAFLVPHLLEHVADTRPESVLVVHEERAVTYGEVEAAANRLAHLLRARGIRRGDRVGLLAHNAPLYVEAYYGILKAGAVAVPLNTAADGPSLRQFLADCGARGLVAGPRFERVVAAAVEALPELELLVAPDPDRVEALPAHIRGVSLAEAESESAERPAAEIIDLDVASIIYTSGSTGRPRGATLSHLNIMANTRSIVSYLGLTAEDRVLQILPFYYVYGKSLLNTHAAVGGSVVIENRFLFPNTALDTLERERCTGLSGVPSTFAILLNRSNLAKRRLEHLRYVTQAGGGMSPELTRRLMEALPNQRIFVMYGATEASARLSYLDPTDLPRKVGSIGRAIPNVELRVLREDGTEAAVGEEGELVARGANIMRGYWADLDETEKVLDRHGYHTGDLGRRDEEGFLYVVGRKKDMIKAGAHRISAKEIEDVILEHGEVHETAVIGIPDEILGEAIHAAVVFRDARGGDAKELERFLKRRLPPYKVPASFDVRAELPKNPSGKIMKQVLRQEFAGGPKEEDQDGPVA
jgi:acyl-CoA synthetase (AMP-forming)/AMP-acid ligase II